jgi:outer membrane protein OmpA-like peptidoglycan-associated protein
LHYSEKMDDLDRTILSPIQKAPILCPRSRRRLAVQQQFTNGQTVFISRIGLAAITDINITERQVVALALSLQIGLPVLKQRTIVENTNIHKIREQVKTENVEKLVTTVEVKERVKVSFDSETINFETNSAALKADSVKFLSTLGRFLAKNETLWGKVVIEGHTDARGSTEYNMNLSRERAAAVRKVLVKSGVPEARTQSGGYGSARPVDSRSTPLAWARNRRVEMTFSGVRDKAALSKGLETIQPARRSNTP